MLNHYNYAFDGITNTYNFTTKNSILYRVAFIVDETFSSIAGEEIPNIFQLVVEKASDEMESFDSRVSKTIEQIIELFFRKVENALIYVCSDEDEKAIQRHKIFDRWYKNSKHKDDVMKIDNVIRIAIDENHVQTLYTSFLFHMSHPAYDKLISIYHQIEEVLNREK